MDFSYLVLHHTSNIIYTILRKHTTSRSYGLSRLGFVEFNADELGANYCFLCHFFGSLGKAAILKRHLFQRRVEKKRVWQELVVGHCFVPIDYYYHRSAYDDA